MKLRQQPASRGMVWVRQGMQAFRTRPLAYTGLFGAYLFAMILATPLQWVGVLLLWALMPVLSLGFMIATRCVLDGGLPSVRVFAEPFQDRARGRSLLQLGAINALGMGAVLAVRLLLDDGRSAAIMEAMVSGKATPETVAGMYDLRLTLSVLWSFASIALLSVPLWHAPALVHWGGQSTAKALFSSTVACWRNRSAFLVYAAVGAGGLLLVSSAVALVFRLLGLGPLEVVGLFATVLVFFMVFYASLYFTFVDCFEAAGPSPSSETSTPGSTP
jgi:hypothetical protein